MNNFSILNPEHLRILSKAIDEGSPNWRDNLTEEGLLKVLVKMEGTPFLTNSGKISTTFREKFIGEFIGEPKLYKYPELSFFEDLGT